MLGRLHDLPAEGKDFAFETTLASRFYATWLRELQDSGCRVNLVFLWLADVELAVERVRARVRAGGHDIPETTIRRRHERGLRSLFGLYLPVANSWRVFDASLKLPKEIARYSRVDGEVIFYEELWKTIKTRDPQGGPLRHIS